MQKKEKIAIVILTALNFKNIWLNLLSFPLLHFYNEPVNCSRLIPKHSEDICIWENGVIFLL